MFYRLRPLGFYLLITLIFVANAAATPSRFVLKDRSASIRLGKSFTKLEISCLRSSGRVGLLNSKRIWESYRSFIAKEKNRSRRNRLKREERTATVKCGLKIKNLTNSSTPTPSETPSPFPSLTPSPTLPPTPTISPSSSPTPAPSTTPTPSATPTLTELKIRAGGGSYVDSSGEEWIDDRNFVEVGTGTYTATQGIQGTSDPELYSQERYAELLRYRIPVVNGHYEITLHFAEIYFNSAGSRVFDVAIEGRIREQGVDIFSRVGSFKPYTLTLDQSVSDGELNVDLLATKNNAKISAIEIHSHGEGHPFLHVVMNLSTLNVDYDQDGVEEIALDGRGSHTHETGRALAAYHWSVDGIPVGEGISRVATLPIGSHSITLEIVDDNSPAEHLSDTKQIVVYPLSSVQGLKAEYYQSSPPTLLIDIDSLPSTPTWVDFQSTARISSRAGKIGNSPLVSAAIVVLSGVIQIQDPGSYTFSSVGGSATRIFLDGAPVTAPLALLAGKHQLEVRVAIPATANLPFSVKLQNGSNSPSDLSPTVLEHNRSDLAPFINSMPSIGVSGTGIEISGIGFFPAGTTKIVWNGVPEDVVPSSPEKISYTAPVGAGIVSVQIETPQGISNQRSFQYLQNQGSPVEFQTPETLAGMTLPTQMAWGPDGRLYVASVTGEIRAYTFNDTFAITNTEVISTLTTVPNPNILGIAFNPFDPPSPVKIYIAHGKLFASNGGSCPTGAVPYSGEVTVLTGPAFSATQTLLSGLPVSNHDHSVNGLQFDDSGDLLIAVGGNTNAGVGGNCNIGALPESPLSAAVIKAKLSHPGFNGTVTYLKRSDLSPSADQREGELVKLAPNKDIELFATGFRNIFDLIWTSWGALYGTDNGPNIGFGPASTGSTSEGNDPQFDDEFLRLTEGAYFGHPNRSRGIDSPRENIYRNPFSSPEFGEYAPPLASSPPLPSTNGIEEYRSYAFGGQLFGDILLKRLGGGNEIYRATLSPDKSTLSQLTVLTQTPGLDIVTGPGGALLTTDHYHGAITLIRPLNPTLLPTEPFDIFPSRALGAGDVSFVIGGVGFGSLADTSVSFGGVSAQIQSVSGTRIRGIIPQNLSPTATPIDIQVTTNGVSHLLSKSFRYLSKGAAGAQQGQRGLWESELQLPVREIGEVAGGAINGVLYLVGHDSSKTCGFDLSLREWDCNLPSRPYEGDHHAAEVIGGKLYLFGGIGANSENKVQIFDPQSRSWSSGADIPNGGSGSASSALIGNYVYYSGGIRGSGTIDESYRYDPALNQWTAFAAMPHPRNHAASGSDGSRFYIFGGRGPGSGDGNYVAPGFDSVQIYDPQSNTWQTSLDPGTRIPALPQPRGGMGKAAYYRDEFFIIGGETSLAGPPNGVYNRVDVYNPILNQFRAEADLPTARHGIFPIVYNGKIYVAGGGVSAGHSESGVVEVFRP